MFLVIRKTILCPLSLFSPLLNIVPVSKRSFTQSLYGVLTDSFVLCSLAWSCKGSGSKIFIAKMPQPFFFFLTIFNLQKSFKMFHLNSSENTFFQEESLLQFRFSLEYLEMIMVILY